VRRLKRAFRRIIGGSTPSSGEAAFWDGDIVWVTPADVSRADRLKTSLRKITREGLASCSSELVPAGSIVVTSRAPVGNVAIADTELCTNQGCKALVAASNVIEPMFGFHLLASLKAELQSFATGTTFTEIATNRLGAVEIPLPPLAEQAAIVRFLDHADRRIRRYIRAKQKLIKLLEEQKQAIIHRAVTRGHDPDVRLKPSGVEWLGDVPEHWEVRKLRTQFRRQGSGTTPSGDEYFGGGVPWVMTGDLNDGLITKTKRTVTSVAIESISALRLFPAGSLLVAMYGATIGKSGVLSMEACTNQACCVLAEPVNSALVTFLQVVVNLARPHLIEQSYGGGQPNINAEIVRSLRIPVPPRGEQEAIVEAISQNPIATAVERAKREIALLREYRTRLIADVVTGKLDVREAAARLTGEVGEPEPLDESNGFDEGDEPTAEEAELEEVEA
jgi:type I restriction enzyme, S subunit